MESRHLACGQLGDPAGAELGEVRVVMEPGGQLGVLAGFEVKEERPGGTSSQEPVPQMQGGQVSQVAQVSVQGQE